MSWTPHETWLVVCTVLSIAAIVVLISYFKVHAFIALALGAGGVGLASGLEAPDVIKQFQTGFGSTLGSVGILVALGTMLGRLLADSGGAERIVRTIVERSGERGLPWAMALIAMVIGVPLFFEVGVVLLMPVIILTARRCGGSIVRVGIPALAGLSVTHGLLPPHPGPLIAVDAFQADLGHTLALGLLVAAPTVILAGPVFGAWIGKHVITQAPQTLVAEFAGHDSGALVRAPSFVVTLSTLLLPVALMLGKSLVDVLLGREHRVRAWFDFIGDPLMALLIAVLVAMFTLGYARGFSRQKVGALLGSSLAPIAGIVMIIGAGGGFKQMLIASGIGAAIGKAAATSALSPILLGWLIAVAIRLATGSATVATVTAAGLMAPIMKDLAKTSLPLMALSIGCGSLFFSHVNDAGFWLVKEYLGMSVGETIKTWSCMETIVSLVGLGMVLLLSIAV